jgi:hypothetical protein
MPTPDVNPNSSEKHILIRILEAIASLSGGGSVATAWGSITGTLSEQTDLQTALNAANSRIIQFSASDEITPIEAANDVIEIPIEEALTLSGVRGFLTTPQSSGDAFEVDVLKNGVTILSADLTWTNTEQFSNEAVPSVTSLAKGDRVSVSVTQVGAGADAAGLKVSLIGTKA